MILLDKKVYRVESYIDNHNGSCIEWNNWKEDMKNLLENDRKDKRIPFWKKLFSVSKVIDESPLDGYSLEIYYHSGEREN